MLNNLVTLIYLNAEGISWTNLTSLISVHLQHLRKHLGKHVLLIEIVSNKKVHHQQYHQQHQVMNLQCRTDIGSSMIQFLQKGWWEKKNARSLNH